MKLISQVKAFPKNCCISCNNGIVSFYSQKRTEDQVKDFLKYLSDLINKTILIVFVVMWIF